MACRLSIILPIILNACLVTAKANNFRVGYDLDIDIIPILMTVSSFNISGRVFTRKRYNLSESTLRYMVKRKAKHGVGHLKQGAQTILPLSIEKQLLDKLRKIRKHGGSVNRSVAKGVARSILGKESPLLSQLTDSWVQSFLRRHSEHHFKPFND